MKKMITLLLAVTILIGAFASTPASAKVNGKGQWDTPLADIGKNTDTKYHIVAKSNKNIKQINEFTMKYNTWSYEVNSTTVKPQLQLVNAETGKAVKATKVKWIIGGSNYSNIFTNLKDNTTHDLSKYITKKGKFNMTAVIKYLAKVDGSVAWYDYGVLGGISVYAVYKNKIYEVWLQYSDDVKNQQLIASDPFKYVKAQVQDEWQLVPSDYTWGYDRRACLSVGIGNTFTDDSHYVALAKGTEQTWVLRSLLTGEEKSLEGCPTKLTYDGKKDPKAVQLTDTGTKVTGAAKGLYTYAVYYDGKVYENDIYTFNTEEECFAKEWRWNLNVGKDVTDHFMNAYVERCGYTVTDKELTDLYTNALHQYIGDDFGEDFVNDYKVTYDGLSEEDYRAVHDGRLPFNKKDDFAIGYRTLVITMLCEKYDLNLTAWLNKRWD